MTEGLSSSPEGVKRVPIRDRACTMGDLTGVNGSHANRIALKQRFTEGGYHLHETPHFLPLLMTERFPFLTEVVGLDIATDSFPTVRAIAREHQLYQVRFLQAHLLTCEIATPGRFDTVTAIHLLEHFAEDEMYRVLTKLLQLTSQCLIIAVPYEPGEPEVAYGHAQLFTPNKLEAVGQWCLHQVAGQGRMAFEECAGGLLLIERDASSRRDAAITCVV